MTKSYYPVILHLDYECEYSIDDGTTWNALAADTRVEIDPTTMSASKMVKVRTSSVSATSINRTKMEMRDRKLSHFNIRNGKGLTNTDSLFQDTNIGEIRVNYTPNVTSANSMFYRVIANTIGNIGIPSASTFSSMFTLANIGKLGNVSAGSNATDVISSYMFNTSKINVAGEVNVPNIGECRNMFYSADIDMFPYIDLDIPTNRTGTYTPAYMMFRYLKSKYALYGKYTVSYDGTLRAYLFQDYIFNGMQSRFLGFDLKSYCVGSSTFKSPYYAYRDSSELKAPFSRLATMSSSTSSNKLQLESFYNTNILDVLTEEDYAMLISDSKKLVEIPEWMPKLDILETLDTPVLVGASSLLAYNDYSTDIVYSGGDMNSSYGVTRRLNDYGFSSKDNTFSSSMVFMSKSGNYAVQTGSDIVIKDSADSTVATISGVTALSGYASIDGEHLYIVTGDVVNITNSDDQNGLTNTITKYSMTDGSVVSTHVLTNDLNTHVSGVYAPSDDYKIKVLRTSFADDGFNGKAASSSEITSYEPDLSTEYAKEDLPGPADKLFPNYAENAECLCVNTQDGISYRIFGE